MRKYILLLALLCMLLAATGSRAQVGPPGPYTVEPGIAAGGRYHLVVQSWRVTGSAVGGGYHLQGPAAPRLRGSGCCCLYLPLVLRNH